MLCETLGFASPRHLLSQITPAEHREWMAYLHIRSEETKKARTPEPKEAPGGTPEQLRAAALAWAGGSRNPN